MELDKYLKESVDKKAKILILGCGLAGYKTNKIFNESAFNSLYNMLTYPNLTLSDFNINEKYEEEYPKLLEKFKKIDLLNDDFYLN